MSCYENILGIYKDNTPTDEKLMLTYKSGKSIRVNAHAMNAKRRCYYLNVHQNWEVTLQ